MASLNPLSGTLGHRLAAHLLRRTSYHYTRAQIDAFAGKTVTQAMDDLMIIPSAIVAEPIDYETGQPWINSGVESMANRGRLRSYIAGWWMDEARQDPSIGHKMMFFLHTNFVVAAMEGPSEEYFDYLALLRHYAVGNFKVLAYKMVLDNQMLRYLDNTANLKGKPNENFAREYLELFTIGKGQQVGPGDYTNYTEEDIVEAARVLTGFRTGQRDTHIDPDTNLPMGRAVFGQHELGDKTFTTNAFQDTIITGATNQAEMFQELQDFVDMIFAQDATATFICRKLYRYFVGRHISQEIEEDIITPLAIIFRANNYELEPVLRVLLSSQHFYDKDDSKPTDEIVGGMLRSPLELFLHTMSFFDIAVPDALTETEDHYFRLYHRWVNSVFFPKAGFNVFRPSTVAGYAGYYQEPTFHRNWFNSSSIIARYKLGEMLILGRRVLAGGTIPVQFDLPTFVQDTTHITDADNAILMVQEFLDYLFPEAVSQERFDYYLNDIFLQGQTTDDWSYEWQAYLLNGDDTEVRLILNGLVESIMYSPEYQLM
ncbi:MAG: DUF1800 family protein [Bacteroidota bacterium]